MKEENLNFNLYNMMGFYVNRTAFLMTEGIYKKFNQNGFNITAQDFGILNILWNEDKQTHANISKKTLRDKTTITRRIDNLEKKGFIKRDIDQKDKRIIRVCLTDKGYEIKNKLITILLDYHKDLLHDISDSDLETTKKTLERIISKSSI